MFKLLVVVLALICSVSAKPAVVAYSAPLLAAAPAGVVTATSSQYIARNYNGLAAAPIVAAAYTAPAAAYTAPAAAYTAPAAVAPVYPAHIAAAYTAPIAAPAAYTAPVAGPLAAAAYTAPGYYPYAAGYTALL